MSDLLPPRQMEMAAWILRKFPLLFLGAFLSLGGAWTTVWVLFVAPRYTLELRNEGGRIAGRYERRDPLGAEDRAIPPGSPIRAEVRQEARSNRWTDIHGHTTYNSSTVDMLCIEGGGDPIRLERGDAVALARAVNDLPRSPPGTVVTVEKPYQTVSLYAGAVLGVIGGIILALVIRTRPRVPAAPTAM